MTVLFSGNLNVPSGQTTGASTAATGAKRIKISMDCNAFPTGTTTLEIQISTDGGATFPFIAIGTYVGPAAIPARFEQLYHLEYSVADSLTITHTRFRI